MKPKKPDKSTSAVDDIDRGVPIVDGRRFDPSDDFESSISRGIRKGIARLKERERADAEAKESEKSKS